MSMMNLDAGFVSTIAGGMVAAFVGPMVVSFATCRVWRKFELRSNAVKWLLIFLVLLACIALSHAFFPLFTMFALVAFPLIPLGSYVGRNLAR